MSYPFFFLNSDDSFPCGPVDLWICGSAALPGPAVLALCRPYFFPRADSPQGKCKSPVQEQPSGIIPSSMFEHENIIAPRFGIFHNNPVPKGRVFGDFRIHTGFSACHSWSAAANSSSLSNAPLVPTTAAAILFAPRTASFNPYPFCSRAITLPMWLSPAPIVSPSPLAGNGRDLTQGPPSFSKIRQPLEPHVTRTVFPVRILSSFPAVITQSLPVNRRSRRTVRRRSV